MFGLSSKSSYGLCAVIELARSYGEGPTQSRDISKRYRIPHHYLEQILGTLKRSNLVQSLRGARGGYVLTTPPGELTILDVLSALEGPLKIAPAGIESDELAPLWNQLESRIAEFLNKSIADLSNDVAAQSNVPDYII